MKLCMMSCMMYRYKAPEIVRTAVECGMTAVDWVCSNTYAPPAVLRQLSADAGLTIAAHTVLNSAFVRREENALDDFKRSLDFACELGAPVLMLPPFPRQGQVSLSEDRKEWTEFYALILPLVQKAGLTLTLESTGIINSPIVTADEVLEVLHQVPGLKCTLDHGNMETAGSALDAYTRLKEYVVHFHLKDWKITDTPHPGGTLKRCGKYFSDAVIGTGDMDLEAFWKTVDPAGRELYVNIETMDFVNPDATAAVLKQTARLLQNW